MQFELGLDEIRDLLGEEAILRGAWSGRVTGIASLEEARPGDLSFCTGERYRRALESSEASVVLLPTSMEAEPPADRLFLAVDNPSLALARICRTVENRLWPEPEPGIHSSAWVAPDAMVDPSACIGPLCVVGPGSVVGAGTHLVAQVHVGRATRIAEKCWLAPQTVVGDFCEVGQRCRIHAGTVLGSDGFGYEPDGKELVKLPQIGRVVLEEDVEIGALSCIDRARFAETRIGGGTKIDNHVHVAHNVRIGRCTAIAAQVGISGSATIGDGVLILGKAGLAGHLTIGDGAVIAGGAGVTKDVAPGQKVRGNPAMEMRVYDRLLALQRKLPDFVKRIEMLEELGETRTGSGLNR